MQQLIPSGAVCRGLALGLLAALACALPLASIAHNPQVSFEDIRPTVGELKLRFDASLSVPEASAPTQVTRSEPPAADQPLTAESTTPAAADSPVVQSSHPPQPRWTAAAREISSPGPAAGSGADTTASSRSAEAKTTMMALILGTVFVVTVGSLIIMRFRTRRERPLISPFDASYRKTTQVSLPENL